jgi:hypothetical protein
MGVGSVFFSVISRQSSIVSRQSSVIARRRSGRSNPDALSAGLLRALRALAMTPDVPPIANSE